MVPADPQYEAARGVFNAAIDRRPALIAQCAGAEDVAHAVNFAREQNLLVAVRGTGHNVAGFAVCDDGLVVDLTAMKGIEVDPQGRTVRVEGGCTWGEVNDALQPFALAATGGFVSVTGVSGLTLGGGLGWLVRKHGLALDNLLSAEVVLADGQQVMVSADENEELFWAIRGGGGNFGVVTSFVFQAHHLGAVLAGIVLHPAAVASDAIRRWRDLEASAPTSPLKAHSCSIFPTTPRTAATARCAGWPGRGVRGAAGRRQETCGHSASTSLNSRHVSADAVQRRATDGGFPLASRPL